MKRISWFISFFCLLFSCVFLSGCILEKKERGSQITVPADWQTYQNEDKKLSFQYPLDWQFNLILDEPEMFGAELKKEDSEQEKILVYEEEMVPFYSININVSSNPQGLSARESRLNQFAAASREAEEAKLISLKVNGQEGVKYLEGTAPASGSSMVVVVAYGDKLYRFTYSALATPETHEKFLNVFDQLLASVKFLK
jgi:hypothetical protein